MQKLKYSFNAVFSGKASNRQFVEVFGAILFVVLVIGLLYICV